MLVQLGVLWGNVGFMKMRHILPLLKVNCSFLINRSEYSIIAQIRNNECPIFRLSCFVLSSKVLYLVRHAGENLEKI